MVETGYYVVEEIIQLLVEECTDVNAAVLKREHHIPGAL